MKNRSVFSGFPARRYGFTGGSGAVGTMMTPRSAGSAVTFVVLAGLFTQEEVNGPAAGDPPRRGQLLKERSGGGRIMAREHRGALVPSRWAAA